MPKKRKPSPKGKDLVIAPGGFRKRETVHALKSGESVFVQQGYGPVVTRSPRGIATEKMRSADAPANFVLTPGGFRHRSLVHRGLPWMRQWPGAAQRERKFVGHGASPYDSGFYEPPYILRALG